MSEHWPNIEDMEDYNRFVQRVEDFLEKEKIDKLNPIIDEDGVLQGSEFSWTPCECCGRGLGGARFEADAYSQELHEIVGPFDICWDCLYFLEYGQLDDETMLDIEDEEDK